MAPSIWRRLLMQAFICEVVRARTKFGIAIAANRPMMATTIMISTRVKPDLREDLFRYILTNLPFFLRGERDNRRLHDFIFVHRLPVAAARRKKQSVCQNLSHPKCPI